MRGEHQAQEAVYRELASPVYTMAVRVLQNVQLAEDVTQDTFIDVFTKASSVNDPSSFIGWVHKIATNHCLMKLRSPWHTKRIPQERDYVSTDANTENADLTLDVERVLASLAPITRMVVWMYCVEGYTHSEIGKVFGKTSSFSKSQFNRAVARIRMKNEPRTQSNSRGGSKKLSLQCN